MKSTIAWMLQLTGFLKVLIIKVTTKPTDVQALILDEVEPNVPEDPNYWPEEPNEFLENPKDQQLCLTSQK
jgi:hypothetical protein